MTIDDLFDKAPSREQRFNLAGLTYDSATGEFFKSGRRRDHSFPQGYRAVKIKGVLILAHRLAWKMHYGEWPPFGMQIDHRNGDKADNRIENLRLATPGQNIAHAPAQKSCRSGERGVYWHTASNRWRIHVASNGKNFELGASHKISAIVAVRLIRRVLHGEFAT